MEFELITSIDAWQAIASEWDALLENSHIDLPYLRYAFQQAWWHTRGGGEWQPESTHLRIILARHESRLVGIAPLFEVPGSSGQTELMLIGSIEVADYLDLIATADDLQEFTNGLLNFLASHSLTQGKPLNLFNILEDSLSLPLLTASAKAGGWQYAQERLQPCPQVLLPLDWEEYLANLDKKQRHEIRRKIRRLEGAELPSHWRMVQNTLELQPGLAQFMDMMVLDPAKQAFLTPTMRQFFTEISHSLLDAGILHLSFLEIDGKPAAGYFCLLYNHALWVYNSAWEGTFSEYSPGWVLLAYLVQWAIENQLKAIDFMRGDEAYKYKFGGVDRFVTQIRLSQP